jgi:hypothetical protein
MSEEKAERRTLLAGILDEMIPPSVDGLPGAGELGIADWVAEALEEQPGLEALLVQGLVCVRRLAEERDPAGFAALSRPDRQALLREVETTEPAFFGVVLMYTYLGYYSHRLVTERLGVQSPPQPKGYELEPGDLGLLEPVRQRSALYRDC